MKAVLCNQFGLPESLTFEDVAAPLPGKDDVLIQVKACGVNFPDTLMIQGKYQFKPPFPFSPGGEVAGIVTAVGDNVTHLKAGDRVFSLTGHGGFAEEVIGKASSTLPMLPDMDFVTAASTMYTYGTSYHALNDRANLKPGETLLVLGAAGGVGLAAVQLGRLLGARVIAAASTDEKLAVCRELGANETINYTRDDLRQQVKELTNGNGADVVYDPVGDRYAEPGIRSLAWRGRYLVVGFAAGSIPSIPLNLALLKGASIVGVFWGAFAQREPKASEANLRQILTWVESGQLKQHIHRIYSLDETATALRALVDRQVIGKAVVQI
ncbi:NADPH:quinone oxidoreductase family protein [Spirosoma terrae]|uniref:NADPH:quinone oxidoreductase family protein n=1 Tax=Spirosoma terrae TaxID=1968276 RepID=A0A6L9L649_9BACT|nr:NADPH:quinone oxidoreductase family protein [Spirosoma terrae]NDU94293.1 NADPH:quinone oxidoreductase family protein [Spirosoma terrae]